MYNINVWPSFKDHYINCTSLNAAGCANNNVAYTFSYDLTHTPLTVTFACSCCNLTTTLNYTTIAGQFLALSTRVGYTEPRRHTLSWKNFSVRRY
jgi:hypothetical protein